MNPKKQKKYHEIAHQTFMKTEPTARKQTVRNKIEIF